MKAQFSRSGAMSERLGGIPDVIVEAEWFQLTYNDLRISPDGDVIARYDHETGRWTYKPHEENFYFSDVVIFNQA